MLGNTIQTFQPQMICMIVYKNGDKVTPTFTSKYFNPSMVGTIVDIEPGYVVPINFRYHIVFPGLSGARTFYDGEFKKLGVKNKPNLGG